MAMTRQVSSEDVPEAAGSTPARRVELALLPTPLHAAPELADAIGVRGSLLVKRDDLIGFALAGNKARPLEFLVADALAQGADTFVTGGAPGSNFCPAAAAAAARVGLACVVVHAGSSSDHPNCAAARTWGAELRWTGDSDRASVDPGIERVAGELARTGRRPYVTPRGGATPVGALGFHLAAQELQAQLAGPATVMVATGSGGTTAGLVCGAVALGRELRIRSASVSRPPGEAQVRVLALARGCAELVGSERPTDADVVLGDARGPGHGLASAEGEWASAVALRTAGLVLDPVYTAKALAALPRLLGEQRDDPDLTTVFWHTGGLLDAVAGWERT